VAEDKRPASIAWETDLKREEARYAAVEFFARVARRTA
jgi:hypothetical protein